MGKKLYVGNISYNTTEDGLRKFFEKAGTVKSAIIIMNKTSGKSRGFGFVEMSSEEEAKKAIEMFNGKELDGRNIKVNEARPMDDRKPRGGFEEKSQFQLSKEKEFEKEFYPNGYQDERLFDESADKIAQRFGKRISFTKIRQYYNEVNNLYHSFESNKESKELRKNIGIKLKLLIAKAMYDSGRREVSENFVHFLKINERLVRKNLEENLEIFKKHFEAIISFSKVYLKK